MIMETKIPRVIAALTDAPAGFKPCFIPVANLGHNWDNHADFSRLRNKAYWVLFVSGKQGVFSRKADCLAWLPQGADVAAVVGCFQTWAEVLHTWAKHCYHRHSKCRQHALACSVGTCPSHMLEADEPLIKNEQPGVIKVQRRTVKREGASVKREVKVEIKREVAVDGKAPSAAPRSHGRTTVPLPSPSPPPITAPRASPPHVVSTTTLASIQAVRVVRARSQHPRAPPPSYSPVPETQFSSSDDDLPPGFAPLYRSDSPDGEPVGRPARPATEEGRAGLTRRAGSQLVDTTSRTKVRRVEEIRDGGTSTVTSPSTTTSPATSAVSSLSTSTSTLATAASISIPAAAHPQNKGKGRAEAGPANGSSISQGLAMPPHGVSRDDLFYVSAAGAIHHSSEAAFADVSAGPVQVVIGWKAATVFAQSAVRRAAGQASLGVDLSSMDI
ncbi:hypothetical protein C8R43DRAFT_1120394 [Mycena crocata]|nr:hypothetical protein C8R43DRAFT_1120394 [Mycena crocata]